MICPSCNKEIDASVKFCGYCGSDINRVSSQKQFGVFKTLTYKRYILFGLISITIAIAFLAIYIPFQKDKNDWDKACQINTKKSYGIYLFSHPKGRYKDLASSKILSFKRQAKSNVTTLRKQSNTQNKQTNLKSGNFSKGYFTDVRDNCSYKWVKIGNQIWMAENLRYLPKVYPPTDGSGKFVRYYIYGYNSNSLHVAKNKNEYKNFGVLYNWRAAINSCPKGWHLPTNSEWKELFSYLGGEEIAGKKMKSAGAEFWKYPNSNASNSCGFSALPGGDRRCDGTFGVSEIYGYWWSSTNFDSENSWFITLDCQYPNVGMVKYKKEAGFSVRCIKD